MFDYRVVGTSRPFVIQIAGQHSRISDLFYHVSPSLPELSLSTGVYPPGSFCYCRKRARFSIRMHRKCMCYACVCVYVCVYVRTYVRMYIICIRVYACMYVWVTYLALLMWSIIYRDFARRTRIENAFRREYRQSIRTVHANSRVSVLFIMFIQWIWNWNLYTELFTNSLYSLRLPVDEQNDHIVQLRNVSSSSVRSFCSSTRWFSPRWLPVD